MMKKPCETTVFIVDWYMQTVAVVIKFVASDREGQGALHVHRSHRPAVVQVVGSIAVFVVLMRWNLFAF